MPARYVVDAPLPSANDLDIAIGHPARMSEPCEDAAVVRRRSKALGQLATYPGRQIAVIADAGNPAVVGIAVRDVAYGEIEIAEKTYDAYALLALMQQYGHA